MVNAEWDAVFAHRVKEDENGCWIWGGIIHPTQGYGKLRLLGEQQAHRVSYILANGPITPGEGYHGNCVCHSCDARSCVRPDHLFVGSHADNMRDRNAKGRSNLPRGDKHFAATRPEVYARGDDHWARRNPEALARGERNGAKTKPECTLRGDDHPGAKLTSTQVLEIREAWAEETAPSLAHRYGCSRQTIKNIVNRKTWRHL